jgi:hypothetical protein
MGGLIYKDIVSLRKRYLSNARLLLIIMAFFVMFALSAVYGNFTPRNGSNESVMNFGKFIFIMCAAPLFVCTVSVSAPYNDQKNGFKVLELTMPLTDGKKVLAKYLTLLLGVFSSAVYLVIPVVCCKIAGQDLSGFAYAYLLAMELAAQFGFVLIPIEILGNTGKKTKAALICFALILFGVAAMAALSEPSGVDIEVVLAVAYHGMGLIALLEFPVMAVLFGLSYYLALKAYRFKRGRV